MSELSHKKNETVSTLQGILDPKVKWDPSKIGFYLIYPSGCRSRSFTRALFLFIAARAVLPPFRFAVALWSLRRRLEVASARKLEKRVNFAR